VKQDIVYALRGFRRAPLVALTIVSTVALGLGLVTVAFTILTTALFRVDRVPNVDEMFALDAPRTGDDDASGFTRADLDALRRETGIFRDAYAEMTGIDVRVDGRTLLFTLTTGNFFQIAGVEPVLGRPLTSDDDAALPGRAVIVLSDRGWERLFNRDRAVIGRRMLVNDVPFEIVGVMPEGFRGLSVIPPDCWVPLSTVAQLRPMYRGREAGAPVRVIGRLRPGMTRDTAVAGLSIWASTRTAGRANERRTPGITLVPWRGTVNQTLDAVAVTGPLFFAFGLVLLIGCANVTNLLLARAVSRQREIGIRLSLGAARARIVRQLLTESLLLALMAAAVGLAISRVALRIIIDAVLTSWPPEIGNIHLIVPDADWRVLLFLVAGAGVSTVSFALFPALQATHVPPIAMMRGEVLREARPGRTRGFLIGVQVSVSALLLIAAAVFLRSAFAAGAGDTGMRTADSVTIGIANEPMRQALVMAVRAEPLVDTVAASWPSAIAPPQTALAEIPGAKASVGYRFVSPEYFGVLDVRVVRGRLFTPGERMPSLPVAVVSETAARTLWPGADPLGQVVRLDRDPSRPNAPGDPSLESRTLTVVGVVRDVAGFRIAPFVKSVFYIPANDAMPKTALTARVHGDPETARQKIFDRVRAIDSRVEQDQVGVASWITRMETYLLKLAFWMTVSLGALALVLTLSGLFSVLSYLVEQRRREIGVRMALGATTRDVTWLVMVQSLKPVGIGLAAGGGAAAGFSKLLLTTSAAAALGGIVHVLDPLAYAASLLAILTACLAAASIPAVRAARVDPALTLRAE